jgi:hypothetical protein
VNNSTSTGVEVLLELWTAAGANNAASMIPHMARKTPLCLEWIAMYMKIGNNQKGYTGRLDFESEGRQANVENQIRARNYSRLHC